MYECSNKSAHTCVHNGVSTILGECDEIDANTWMFFVVGALFDGRKDCAFVRVRCVKDAEWRFEKENYGIHYATVRVEDCPVDSNMYRVYL